LGNPSAMFSVVAVCGTAEAVIGEKHQVIAFAFAACFSARRALCNNLAVWLLLCVF